LNERNRVEHSTPATDQGSDRPAARDRHSRRESKGAAQNGSAKEESLTLLTPVAETATPDDAFYLPQIGVEIVGESERNGVRFYSIRDLRNGHVIHNVTRKGARK